MATLGLANLDCILYCSNVLCLLNKQEGIRKQNNAYLYQLQASQSLENVSLLGNVCVNILAMCKHSSFSSIIQRGWDFRWSIMISICKHNCLQVAGSLVQNEAIVLELSLKYDDGAL